LKTQGDSGKDNKLRQVKMVMIIIFTTFKIQVLNKEKENSLIQAVYPAVINIKELTNLLIKILKIKGKVNSQLTILSQVHLQLIACVKVNYPIII
jgi:hypothetical protein